MKKQIITCLIAFMILGSTFVGDIRTTWAESSQPACNINKAVAEVAATLIAHTLGTTSQGSYEWGTVTQQPLSLDQALGTVLDQVVRSLPAIKGLPPVSVAYPTPQNSAFHHVQQINSVKAYTVTGEVSLFKGIYHYAVKQGENVIAGGFGKASQKSPAWGSFTEHISIPAHNWSNQQPLTFELLQVNETDGSVLQKLTLPLNAMKSTTSQGVFRNVTVAQTNATYTINGNITGLVVGPYHYVITQGNTVIQNGTLTGSQHDSGSATFTRNISIPANKLSGTQPLTLELFGKEAANQTIIHKLTMELK